MTCFLSMAQIFRWELVFGQAFCQLAVVRSQLPPLGVSLMFL